ncbi:MAG: hypothetical protein ABJB12_24005 [Pseudomonadota bacterium]
MTRMTEGCDVNAAKAQGSDAVRVRGLQWVLLFAAGFQFGCNGAGSGAASANGGVTSRDTAVKHEACDTKAADAEKIDANGDGKPDITIVREGGREVCRAVDLNFDGVVDAYSYFDGGGQLRRRENDYDKDGQIDEIISFKSGQIAEKDQSTALAAHLDTWDFYQAGALVRTERDSNGDGVIDQWWEYPKPGCPLIHADMNNDGRPDPGATIDYCKETGYVPPDRSDKAVASPTFDTKTSMPTETENKVPTETSKPAEGTTPAATTPATATPAKPAADQKGTQK